MIALPKGEAEEPLEAFIQRGMEKQLSEKTISTRRQNLLTHFAKSGKELDIEQVKILPRYRSKPEHTPSPVGLIRMADSAGTLRDRAVILSLYTSGLRDSTFKALRYKDVKADLEAGLDTVLLPYSPEMKGVVGKACKNNIPYYSFPLG